MTGCSRALARAACCIGVLMALSVGSACADLSRTNPLEAQGEVELVISGPDSVTAVGDTVVFELRSADGQVVTQLARWAVPNFVTPISGVGRFVVTGVQTLARSNGTITARVNASSVSRSFIF